MFYSTELLLKKKDSPIGVVWLAATLNNKKLTKRDYANVDVVKACEFISAPPEPLALRLSSNLMVGVTRIHKHQIHNFNVDVNQTFVRLKQSLYGKTAEVTAAGQTEAKPEAITLMSQDTPSLDIKSLNTTQIKNNGNLAALGWMVEAEGVLHTADHMNYLSSLNQDQILGSGFNDFNATLEIQRIRRPSSVAGSRISEHESKISDKCELLINNAISVLPSFPVTEHDLNVFGGGDGVSFSHTTTSGSNKSAAFSVHEGIDDPFAALNDDGGLGIILEEGEEEQKVINQIKEQKKRRVKRKRTHIDLVPDERNQYTDIEEFIFTEGEVLQQCLKSEYNAILPKRKIAKASDFDFDDGSDLTTLPSHSEVTSESLMTGFVGGDFGLGAFENDFIPNDAPDGSGSGEKSVSFNNDLPADFEGIEVARKRRSSRKSGIIVPWTNFRSESEHPAKSEALSEFNFGISNINAESETGLSTRKLPLTSDKYSEPASAFDADLIKKVSSDLDGEVLDFKDYVKSLVAPETSVKFQTILPPDSCNKATASKGFFNLLVLATKSHVKLYQEENEIMVDFVK